VGLSSCGFLGCAWFGEDEQAGGQGSYHSFLPHMDGSSSPGNDRGRRLRYVRFKKNSSPHLFGALCGCCGEKQSHVCQRENYLGLIYGLRILVHET
jgi:hypothetical protein